MVNVRDDKNVRWNVVYIKQGGEYIHVGREYVKTSNPLNLDPFENWPDNLMDPQFWVHPVHARNDGVGGWYLKAYDTYNKLMVHDKTVNISLNDAHRIGILFKSFDALLKSYEEMTDEELLKELNVGRLDKLEESELL